MTILRQMVLVTFVLGSLLNLWFVWGALSGYTYYWNVSALDPSGALQVGLWVEIALAVVCGCGWWIVSRNAR